ncbi:MAG: class I adenylate-forming enzyme family protein [Acidimicrobiales bacterium]
MPHDAGREAATIADFVRASADRHGDHEAIVLGSTRLSYRALDAESQGLARGLLAIGVGKGDRVGLFMADGPNWLRAWAAVGRIGAIAVTMSTFSKGDELVRAIRHPDVVGVIFDRTIAGSDTVDRFESALPQLCEQQSPHLRLAEAPFLRWLASSDAEAPQWAVDMRWIEAQASTGAAVDDDLLRAAEREVQPDDAAMMIYTSGSTSEPKGVVHSHRTVFVKTAHVARGMSFVEGERTYSPLPLFWVGGLINSLLPTLAHGGTVFCLERFDAGAVLELIGRERLTRIQAYPQHAAALAEHPALADCDVSSIRWAPPALMSGPIPAPPRGFFAALGMTETFGPYGWGLPDGEPSTMAVYIPIDDVEPGYEIKLVDESGALVAEGQQGEILVRGPTLTSGLYKRDRTESFDADGFYRTGDLGVRSGPRIRFAGRKGNMIKRGGANVAPNEIEDLLLSADGVEQAFVVGIPDELRGELIGAAVIARPGATLNGDALRQWAKSRISVYKVPDLIVVMARDEVPRTASQKVSLPALATVLSDAAKEIRCSIA